jgi:hypothetical protein
MSRRDRQMLAAKLRPSNIGCGVISEFTESMWRYRTKAAEQSAFLAAL